MKRILVLALALILAVSSLAVPSYAAENSSWIELLDYISLNESGNYFTITGSGTISYNLPFSMSLKYVDILASYGSYLFSGAKAFWEDGSSTDLTVVDLGNGLCRIYGYVPQYAYNSLGFSFTSPGTTYCTILSLKVSSKALSGFSVPVSAFLFADGKWKDFTYSGSGESASVKIPISNSITSWYYSAGINFSNWQNYDFIDIAFSLYGAASINSLSAMFDSADGDLIGSYIPIDYSHISQSFYNDGNYEVVVRIDLTGVDRTSDNVLVLRIEGEHNGEEISFYISDVSGYVVPSYADPDVYFLHNIWLAIVSGFNLMNSRFNELFNAFASWYNFHFDRVVTSIVDNTNSFIAWATGFSSSLSSWLDTHFGNINNRFNELFNAFSSWYNYHFDRVVTSIDNNTNILVSLFSQLFDILDSSGDNEQFQDDVGQQGDKLDDMQQVMDSVQKPDLGSINTDLSGIVSPADTANIAQVYTMVIGDDFVPQIMTMVVIMAMMSFVLFGKR